MLPLLTFSVVVLFTLNLSQNEVQVMRSLCHPNILPFYCSFVTRHEVWHVLPLMQLGEGVNYFLCACDCNQPYNTHESSEPFLLPRHQNYKQPGPGFSKVG